MHEVIIKNNELQALVPHITTPLGPLVLHDLHEELIMGLRSALVKFSCGEQNWPIACRVRLKSLLVWHCLSMVQHQVVQQTSENHWAHILQFWLPKNST